MSVESLDKEETPVYLTKRIVVQRARAGIKKAAKNAMKTAGYVVVAENGWVIKKYADGREEKLTKLETIPISEHLGFDQ